MGDREILNYKLLSPNFDLLMCLAPDFAERDDVGEEGDDEQPRLAGQQEQDAPAQDQPNQQINQNRQRKFH